MKARIILFVFAIGEAIFMVVDFMLHILNIPHPWP